MGFQSGTTTLGTYRPLLLCCSLSLSTFQPCKASKLPMKHFLLATQSSSLMLCCRELILKILKGILIMLQMRPVAWQTRQISSDFWLEDTIMILQVTK